MTSKFTKAAAISAASLLMVAGAQGVASAQSSDSATGSISADSLGSDSVKAFGSSPEAGSLLDDVNNLGTGSFDTTGSLLGEPTSGSLGASVQDLTGGSVNASYPAPGTASVDTTGSLLGEPTTGSLAPVALSVGDSLGTSGGITTVVGNLLPLVAAAGSLATAAGAGAVVCGYVEIPGLQLPAGLPECPALPGQPAPGNQAPAPAPAPGPDAPNGRG